MKKISLLFVLVLVCGSLFNSCTKDISGPVDTNFLEAKWNFNKATVLYSGIEVPFSTTYLQNEPNCNKDYLDMATGNVLKFGNYPASCTLDEKSGTWSLSGSNLVVAVAGTNLNDTFQIAKLTETELILQIAQTYQGQTGTLNLYFSK